MCGLAGVFHYGAGKQSSEAVGLKMIDALAHRGPDDGGLLVTPRLMLGLRRLAILDLSEDGHQPMSDEAQQCWIAFNGEIYNYRELRQELIARGQTFRSQTDTEVILHGYRHWGRAVVERLNGMFAFVLWDCRDDSLWLVRDGVGIKPLFYHDDGHSLRFGSEIKAILADPSVERKPCRRGLDGFLTFGYTAAPLTGFDGIRQLEPGTALTLHQGRLSSRRWYRWPYPSGPSRASLNDCAERLQAALDDAVRSQMVSDVPLGALLSGGLDSSAVVRAMRRATNDPIDTFTVGFSTQSFDESPYAAAVAERYGTRHHTQSMPESAADWLETTVAHAEEPLSDNSMIPFLLLSEQTRRRVTVALSGDGADELLGGYITYSASAWAPYYRRIPSPLRRGLIEPLLSSLPDSQRKYGAATLLRRFVESAGRPFPWDHCSWRRIVSASLRRELYTPAFLAELPGDPVKPYADALDDVPDWASPLEQQLHLDLRFHLPNDMLVKVDRMSMAHSLEVRVPFLDQRVIEACLAMPSSCKRRGRRGKLPLRQMLESELPRDIVHRKKGGFLMPLESLLRGPWQRRLDERLTSEFADTTGLLELRVLEQMKTSLAQGRGGYAYPLFSLLVLAIWWDAWISRTAPPAIRRIEYAPTRVHRLNRQGAP